MAFSDLQTVMFAFKFQAQGSILEMKNLSGEPSLWETLSQYFLPFWAQVHSPAVSARLLQQEAVLKATAVRSPLRCP